ncbi:MAG: hypothetical protein R2747_11355 [Pyrinomonadaceae bacterium]
MRKIIFFVLISVICHLLFGCRDSTKNYRVDLVNRNSVFPPDRSPDPLLLVIRVEKEGRLSLNKIETGTTADPSLLSEKLEAIFLDRQRAGVSQTEVIIEIKTEIKKEQLDGLIQTLADANASPIWIIKNDP